MNERQKQYLGDTIGILFDYDGYRTVPQLMGLVDECRERLVKLLQDDITDDDLGIPMSKI